MKILMVCLGNICRSPLAHGIFEHLVKQKGLQWQIDSAGTGSWHVGEQPDRRSIAVASSYGIDISCQRARQFDRSDFDNFDYIFAMDRANLRDVMSMARTREDRAKVKMFLPIEEVPDPYWDDALFEQVYTLVSNRSEELIEELLEDGATS